MFIHLIERYK